MNDLARSKSRTIKEMTTLVLVFMVAAVAAVAMGAMMASPGAVE